MPYTVTVDDNFHYMDADERYRLAEYADADAAIEQCRRLVDAFLESAYRPGMSSEDLWDSYTSFGEDPFIVSVGAPPVTFSAWGYARTRCAQICGAAPETDGRPAPGEPLPDSGAMRATEAEDFP